MHKRFVSAWRIASRPPPLTPPPKAEGKYGRNRRHPNLNSRRTIRSIAAPISPARIAPAHRSRADLANHRSRAMWARRRFRPANWIPTWRAPRHRRARPRGQSGPVKRDHARYGSRAPAPTPGARRSRHGRRPCQPAIARRIAARRSTGSPPRRRRRQNLVPHRPERPEKSEGGRRLIFKSDFDRRATSRRRSPIWSKGRPP